MKGKELTIKEAMHYMLNGGRCIVNATGRVWYNDNIHEFEWKSGGTHCFYKTNIYYEHIEPEKTPELLEGVGKMAINKEDNNLQYMIAHDEDQYHVYSEKYCTLDDLKKEWHIIG